MRETDYVIVGAGSAGCVLAARLSENPRNRVTLLEAGGSDNSISIRMPAALSGPMNRARFNWGYLAEAEPTLAGRRLNCPRGRVLGGSSSINGMVWVRGHACDFNSWIERGVHGWSYSDCLPYFKKAENWIGGEDVYRGAGGPLAICRGNHMRLNPLYQAFVRAAVEAGYPQTGDYNGFQQEGFGAYQMTVDRGVRASCSRSYLKPAMRRANLEVLTGVLATRVEFEGRRAVAVSYMSRGQEQSIRARAEVILCAGAIGSPALLQRSGIGPPEVLARAGIPVIHALNGVGGNLQDHLEVYFQQSCNEPITLNGKLGKLSQAAIGLRWLLFRTGLGATNHFESGGFIRSSQNVQWPDIQFHFLPGAIRYDGRSALNGHGFQLHVGPNRMQSRGHVAVRSPDPDEAPRICFNYLQEEYDRLTFRRAIRLTREIIAQPAMDRFRGEELQPGMAIKRDDELDHWIAQHAESAYHPSCTCSMGEPENLESVVDSMCRVIGMECLRVVDASIFPAITNGNLNAPVIMVAERAADLIRSRKLLTAVDVPFWVDPEWRTRQRSGMPQRHSPHQSGTRDLCL
ncbi:MAG: choline dehydrogenase [Pseudomonadota bacterium]|nr:choline dehydrogenase [Pseudomonadota bacterium]